MGDAGISKATYWGPGGAYGPFDVQSGGEWAGWPNFGQVLRYFRKQAGLTAKEFGEIYGKMEHPDGSPVSERWIYEMELKNQVPVDINKRKALARLLSIPPVLFGLATLEDIEIRPQAQALAQPTLQRVITDTDQYQKHIRILWQLHDTSNAQHSLGEINADIRDLEYLERQAQGDFLYHVRELLFSYHILAANVVRDQRQFDLSYFHANEAVRVARRTEDDDLTATALYTRGCTRLEWGMFGTIEHGVFQVQRDKISAAIQDFERTRAIGNIHPQLLGMICVHESRALALLNVGQGESAIIPALTMLDHVASLVDRDAIDDPYTRTLVTGTRAGFIPASYLDNRVAALNAAALPGQALQTLNDLERQTEHTYGKDLTRNLVWLEVLRAHTYVGLGQFKEATLSAKQALITSRDINSVTNITNIVDIHGRLLTSSYGSSTNVQELGDMFMEIPVLRVV
jgi:transcriptional regulator with XRE-family HTH domain